MLLARFTSSTKLSGHNAFINSPFDIRWPGWRTSSSQRIEGFRGKRQRLVAAAQDSLARQQPERAEAICLHFSGRGRFAAGMPLSHPIDSAPWQ